jgi:hypothetical protein
VVLIKKKSATDVKGMLTIDNKIRVNEWTGTGFETPITPEGQTGVNAKCSHNGTLEMATLTT